MPYPLPFSIVDPTKAVVVVPPKVEESKPQGGTGGVVSGGDGHGDGVGIGGVGGEGGVVKTGGVGELPSSARVQSAGGPSGGSGEGARASAIAGAFLGILAAASGIMWAGYKLKPGLLGGGGGGGGKGAMNISSPSAGSYQLVSTGGGASGAGGGAGGGAAKGGGGGASYSNVAVTRMDAMNGATTTGLGFGAAGNRMSTMGTQTAGASAGGGASANFVEYFSSMSAMSAAGGGGSGIANYIGGVGRITRAAQTDLPYYGGTLATGYLTEAMAMNAGASGGMLSSTTTSYYQQDAAAARGGGYGTMDNQTIVVDELPPPTLTRGMTAYESQVGIEWSFVRKTCYHWQWQNKTSSKITQNIIYQFFLL